MSTISYEQFTALKAKVKAECLRRNYKDPVASYGGSGYDYSLTPSAGVLTLEEHYEKIAIPMNAINSTNTPITEGYQKIVLADDIQKNLELVELYAKRDYFDASGRDCSYSCTGLCYGCQGTCHGNCVNTCTGTCDNTCTGYCTGCTNSCWGGCYTGCTGCSGCTHSCGGNGCFGACTTSCDGCTAGVGTGACSSGCSINCAVGCTGCGGCACQSCSGSEYA